MTRRPRAPAKRRSAGTCADGGATDTLRTLVVADLEQLALAGWLLVNAEAGWRLIRAPGAPADWPPACQLTLVPESLTVSTAISLTVRPASGTLDVLGRFLAAQPARLATRCQLEAAGELAAALIELALDTRALERGQVIAAVAALTAAYDSVRREVEALCNPSIAAWVQLCEPRVAWSAGPVPEAEGS